MSHSECVDKVVSQNQKFSFLKRIGKFAFFAFILSFVASCSISCSQQIAGDKWRPSYDQWNLADFQRAGVSLGVSNKYFGEIFYKESSPPANTTLEGTPYGVVPFSLVSFQWKVYSPAVLAGEEVEFQASNLLLSVDLFASESGFVPIVADVPIVDEILGDFFYENGRVLYQASEHSWSSLFGPQEIFPIVSDSLENIVPLQGNNSYTVSADIRSSLNEGRPYTEVRLTWEPTNPPGITLEQIYLIHFLPANLISKEELYRLSWKEIFLSGDDNAFPKPFHDVHPYFILSPYVPVETEKTNAPNSSHEFTTDSYQTWRIDTQRRRQQGAEYDCNGAQGCFYSGENIDQSSVTTLLSNSAILPLENMPPLSQRKLMFIATPYQYKSAHQAVKDKYLYFHGNMYSPCLKDLLYVRRFLSSSDAPIIYLNQEPEFLWNNVIDRDLSKTSPLFEGTNIQQGFMYEVSHRCESNDLTFNSEFPYYSIDGSRGFYSSPYPVVPRFVYSHLPSELRNQYPLFLFTGLEKQLQSLNLLQSDKGYDEITDSNGTPSVTKLAKDAGGASLQGEFQIQWKIPPADLPLGKLRPLYTLEDLEWNHTYPLDDLVITDVQLQLCEPSFQGGGELCTN